MKTFKTLECQTTTLKNKNILLDAFDVYINSKIWSGWRFQVISSSNDSIEIFPTIFSDKKSILLGFSYKRMKTQRQKWIIKFGLNRADSCRFPKVTISGFNYLIRESTTIFSSWEIDTCRLRPLKGVNTILEMNSQACYG